MSEHIYDESIQHRRAYKAVGSIPTDYALAKKKKPLPIISLGEYITFNPNARTYHVRIDRRTFKRRSTTFSTFIEATQWRDAELANTPKGEKGQRCCILKNKPL